MARRRDGEWRRSGPWMPQVSHLRRSGGRLPSLTCVVESEDGAEQSGKPGLATTSLFPPEARIQQRRIDLRVVAPALTILAVLAAWKKQGLDGLHGAVGLCGLHGAAGFGGLHARRGSVTSMARRPPRWAASKLPPGACSAHSRSACRHGGAPAWWPARSALSPRASRQEAVAVLAVALASRLGFSDETEEATPLDLSGRAEANYCAGCARGWACRWKPYLFAPHTPSLSYAQQACLQMQIGMLAWSQS